MIPRVIPGVAMAVCCVMPSPRRCGRRRVSPSIESKMGHVAEAVAAVKRNLSARVDGGISGGTGLRSGRIDAPAGIGSLVIGGGIQGGANSLSGSVKAADLGTVVVRGDVVGWAKDP